MRSLGAMISVSTSISLGWSISEMNGSPASTRPAQRCQVPLAS